MASQGVALVWESYKLDPYVQKLAEAVFNYQEKVKTTTTLKKKLNNRQVQPGDLSQPDLTIADLDVTSNTAWFNELHVVLLDHTIPEHFFSSHLVKLCHFFKMVVSMRDGETFSITQNFYFYKSP